MALYREGTLLRDRLGDLWMITGREAGTSRFRARYVLVRLADSHTGTGTIRFVHRRMELVSEA